MEIKLKLDTTYSHIAGNDYGYKVFVEQIEPYFDGKTHLEILFPDYIEVVSISFVQGLIKDMVNKTNKETVLKLVKLKSNNKFLDKRLDYNLRF